MQIQGNENKQQHPTTDEYKLNVFNKDGEKTKIVFSVYDNETPEEISFNKFPYVLEYYTPFSPKQLTISIKGYTADNRRKKHATN
ncbi:hypothetical protein ACIQ57_20965 [Lysinibacillus xylanilyticus]|uniref:hypothetical protein n=1 Tax=Lysinibacillus xylanilyticus TaxID=582475 RepID=UPI0037FF73D5